MLTADALRLESPPPTCAGLATMSEGLSGASNYYRWIYSLLVAHLGRKVLEVGPGFGNLAALILEEGRSYLGVDISGQVIDRLRGRFAGHDRAQFRLLDAVEPEGVEELRRYGADSILLTHVLEHIADPVAYLSALTRAASGGSLVVVVPALPGLYGRWDREAGHYRRYSRSTLGAILEEVGVKVSDLRYFDAAAVPALWLLSRVLRWPLNAGRSNSAISVFDRWVVPWARRVDPMLNHLGGVSLLAVGKIGGLP